MIVSVTTRMIVFTLKMSSSLWFVKDAWGDMSGEVAQATEGDDPRRSMTEGVAALKRKIKEGAPRKHERQIVRRDVPHQTKEPEGRPAESNLGRWYTPLLEGSPAVEPHHHPERDI